MLLNKVWPARNSSLRPTPSVADINQGSCRATHTRWIEGSEPRIITKKKRNEQKEKWFVMDHSKSSKRVTTSRPRWDVPDPAMQWQEWHSLGRAIATRWAIERNLLEVFSFTPSFPFPFLFSSFLSFFLFRLGYHDRPVIDGFSGGRFCLQLSRASSFWSVSP